MPDNTQERNDYDYILTNWERSKTDFMLWLKHVCGVDEDLLYESDELIKDDKCLNQWIHIWDGDFDSIKETNRLYKENI